MNTLPELISQSGSKKAAIGHFNISDLVGLRAIFESAQELGVPVIVGVSEGERKFVGTVEAAMLVKQLRERFNFPIFINADHTHSFEKVKEAVEAGFDAILFDGGKLPLDENIKHTKEVVEYVKSKDKNIMVEGEMGYIGSSSVLLDKIPEGAAITADTITQVEEASRFVKETGVDLLAPAVGNIHGMFKHAPNPNLFVTRVKEIREAVGVPLVLHGGSGIKDDDFTNSIKAGIGIVHINTEIRRAWREGVEEAIKGNPDEVVPYKILSPALDKMKEVIVNRLKLFSNL